VNVRRIFDIVPLLAIPVVLYIVLAAVGAGSRGADVFTRELESGSIRIGLPSGADWWISGGDLFIMLGIGLLFAELARGIGVSRYAILHHTAAVVLFLACLGLFLVGEPFSTTSFFLLTVMCLLDIVGGVMMQMGASAAIAGERGEDDGEY
jgi:hypothetical protein